MKSSRSDKNKSNTGIMSLDLKGNSLKGVYNLNPTKMIMKQGSLKARKALTEDVPGFKKIKKPKTNKGKTK
jgi:hypothetical protein